MRATMRKFSVLILLVLCSGVAMADEDNRRPVDGIMDNSFLVEEAYNQEVGVVQHIFNAVYGMNWLSKDSVRVTDLSFTQEWPLFSQTHQLSYTVPYSFIAGQGGSANGVGDVLLNYRYQVYLNDQTLTAFAPRFTLILPTGDADHGFGDNTLGYQWNLPFSTTFNDRWFAHANAGLTWLPHAGVGAGHDLVSYNLGASAIYCVNTRLNLMLEWIGGWNQSLGNNGLLEREFASLISPGVRYAFNSRSGAQTVVGLGLPIGLTRASPEIGVIVYLSFEHRLWGKAASSAATP
jgi:hypothetical protein